MIGKPTIGTGPFAIDMDELNRDAIRVEEMIAKRQRTATDEVIAKAAAHYGVAESLIREHGHVRVERDFAGDRYSMTLLWEPGPGFQDAVLRSLDARSRKP